MRMVSFCWRCYSFVQLKKLHAGPPTPKHTSPSRVIFLIFFGRFGFDFLPENAGDIAGLQGISTHHCPYKMAPTVVITLEF